MSQKHLGWVADIGGTSIRLALVSRIGEVVREEREPTPADPTPQAVVDVVERLSELILPAKREDLLGMVLGVPGIVDARRGLVLLNANLGWRNVPVAELAMARFGLPVRIENDVRLHTLGEWKYGAGRALAPGSSFSNVVIGTGVAAGVLVHGVLLEEPESGEIGHLTWQRNGWSCGCGKVGCVETVVGAKGLRRLFAEAGHPVTNFMADVVTPFQNQEPWAVALWNTFVRGLAFGLSALIMVAHPELIVISGGIGASFSLFEPMLLSALSDELFPGSLAQIQIVGSVLTDRAPYLGGVHLLFTSGGFG